MTVREANDRDAWDAFVAGQREAQFLQSWDWGEFLYAEGRTVVRLIAEENG